MVHLSIRPESCAESELVEENYNTAGGQSANDLYGNNPLRCVKAIFSSLASTVKSESIFGSTKRNSSLAWSRSC